jgi:hypothetical protein
MHEDRQPKDRSSAESSTQSEATPESPSSTPSTDSHPSGGKPNGEQTATPRLPRQQPTIPTPVPGRAPEVFDRLAAVVDEVLEFEWGAESCADKAAGLDALATQTTRIAAADANGVHALERDPGWAAEGFRTVSSKIAYECNQSRGTSRRRVTDAHKLRELPELTGALAGGEITADAARLILRADTTPLHDQLIRDHKMLVAQAVQLEHDQFAQALRYWVALADTDQADQDAFDAEANRSLHASRTMNGRIRVDGWLDPITGSEWLDELTRLEQQMFKADWADARAKHGERANHTHLARTADQRRHDALIEMARRSRIHPENPAPVGRTVLTLHMDYETFIAELAHHTGTPVLYPTDRLCELDDGTVITPSQALNAALGGEVRRIVFGAVGHILDYGRGRRLFTKALSEAVSARDRTCRQPGCHLPAAKCQTDHVDEWHDLGKTSADNGELLCRFHNNWKHHNPLQWRRQRWNHHKRFGPGPPPPPARE